ADECLSLSHESTSVCAKWFADADDAEVPFDWFLADVTGKHAQYDFILSEPARCPNCQQLLTEKTLSCPSKAGRSGCPSKSESSERSTISHLPGALAD